MNLATFALACLTILCAGFGITLLCLRGQNNVSFSELFGLAWLFGTGWVSLALPCIGVIARGVTLQILVTASCVAWACAGIQELRQRKLRIRPSLPESRLDQLLVLVIAAQIAVVLWLTCRMSLIWDSLFIWELKARYAFLNGGAMPPQYFSDGSRVWSQLTYPLFLPMLETWVYLWLGNCHQFWIKPIFVFFYVTTVLLLHAGAVRLSGSSRLGLLVGALLFFVPYLCFGYWGLPQGLADFPLATVYLGAAIFMASYTSHKAAADARMFAFLAAILPWIKDEGSILWGSLITIASVTMALRWRLLSSFLFVPMPGFALWVTWKLVLRSLHVVPMESFAPLTPAVLMANLDRIGPIAQYLVRFLLDAEDWSLLWSGFFIVIAGVALNYRAQSQIAPPLPLLAAVIVPLALDTGIFFFTRWPSPERYVVHIYYALPRLILQLVPVALLVLGLRMDAVFKATAHPSNEPTQ